MDKVVTNGQQDQQLEVLSPEQLYYATNVFPERVSVSKARAAFQSMLETVPNPDTVKAQWKQTAHIVYGNKEHYVNSIVQKADIKITKAALKTVGDGNLAVNQFQVVNRFKVGEEGVDLDPKESVMWALVDDIPHPKLINLKRYLVYVCLKRFRYFKSPIEAVSDFLKKPVKYVERVQGEIQDDGVFINNRNGGVQCLEQEQ